MNLFDKLVDEALAGHPHLTSLRTVVEKELLHHDILRTMSRAGLLASLSFMGGTCLRECWGSERLSEDLDFTGGSDFESAKLSLLRTAIVDGLFERYGFKVDVSEPVRETGNVDTWKIRIVTRPESRDIPAQRINIDVCSIPSYRARPMLLMNRYNIEMGTGSLMIRAEDREEILVDKLVAFAMRPNRVKHRDIWDIVWLNRAGVRPALDLLPRKLEDHGSTPGNFIDLTRSRLGTLAMDNTGMEFASELKRFLPVERAAETVENPEFREFAFRTVVDMCEEAIGTLAGRS